MMNNYEFIIAGLPQLALDFQSGSFDFQELTGSLRNMLSKKDNRLLDWLEKGLESRFMNIHFTGQYRVTAILSFGIIFPLTRKFVIS